MMIRGLRGATVAPANTAAAIVSATRELLDALVAANELRPDDLASVLFSVTPDLTAQVPARAVRDLGWEHVAVMCLAEMPVPGGLPRCIRVLLHWNTDRAPAEVRHVYLHAAAQLRPDRAAPVALTEPPA